jgi:hypothetical protein
VQDLHAPADPRTDTTAVAGGWVHAATGSVGLVAARTTKNPALAADRLSTTTVRRTAQPAATPQKDAHDDVHGAALRHAGQPGD